MPNQSAVISLLGNREENQDRVKVVETDGSTLLLAIDGMGGHANGARAAALAVETIEKAFEKQPHPVFDPQGFLHLAIGQAHAAVVEVGGDLSVEARPRATCALCLVQDGAAFWAHVGDSRIYHLRGAEVYERTRDHSHVEVLLYDGIIKPEERATHPMRNYVECCLGGDADLPRMSISRQKEMREGDVMLVCSDGFWSPLEEEKLAGLSAAEPGALETNLKILGEMATRAAAPHSDNTSAAALSFCG
ncbi:MAG: serine/threonine-protein phosphatase [Gammaproteobacteria bacterium]|jgi:serine/threonine protein phosphatase PrpC|nr:serine/threonine-protein phosphatase [Gammaproteobacteria bacterium]MDP6616954.1 serine/threonine-protein phosphatase [Gammaproteobacteria bacterium]MDP6694620.1 serine/threonine-protein phosphatase [Gammaproteobacteria bacterium]MDP7041942.1 serine/threonine-protein phosphatase [Gammaproteobacteria bacterium]